MREYKLRITEKDLSRYAEMQSMENSFHAEGFVYVAGADEAGRGPLAGPVTTAVCILDPDRPIYGLDDSKKLSPKRREALAPIIREQALAYAVVSSPPARIDEINILNACKEAMTKAVRSLSLPPDLLLCDALHLEDISLPQRAIIKGDAQVNAIAAASILAKTSRDELMCELDKTYPGYGFAKHKGYGTAEHYRALEALGPCPEHRLSFLSKLKLGSSCPVSQSSGRQAERSVAEHLRSQGYHIREQNYAIPGFGEIDLIAEKGRQLFIIEVKARSRAVEEGFTFEAVDAKKIRRMRILGSYYAQSRGLDDLNLRLLAAACELDSLSEVKHICYREID